jgi:threonine/homoserine/homoserine lactone efflux protein
MWELIFFLVILKIPVAYLCWVVWWAIRAEPAPPEPATLVASSAPAPDDRPGTSHRPRPRRPLRQGPHGSPRSGRRAARVAVARAEARK